MTTAEPGTPKSAARGGGRRRGPFWLLLSAALVLAAPARASPVGAEATTGPDRTARRFDITEYQVDGNSVLTEAAIDEAVYPFLGPDRSPEDVEKARAALEGAYAAKGYPTVSVEIPRQSVADGVVVLKVTERRIGRLRVRGSRFYSLEAIRQGAPSLAEGAVPNMPAVQRDIVALNQWPGRTITPALRPGAAPDTVDVDLQVEDQLPANASAELNNQRSQNTKELRTSASLGYDNLWQRGDSANVTFQTAPQNTANATVLSGSYLFRIPDSALSLLVSYLHSNSNVSTVGATTVVGKGDVAGFRLLVPLGYGDGFVHNLSVGVDYKHFTDNEAVGAGATGQAPCPPPPAGQPPLTSCGQPITYYPLTASYEASWSGATAQSDVQASLVLVPGGLGSDLAAVQQVRAYAQPGYGYFRLDASRTQTLPHDIQLYGHLYAQGSPYALISNEQFPLGGVSSVRGYLEGEALGDNGGLVQTEVRSPSLAETLGWPLAEVRLLAFFDAGGAQINSPLPEQTRSFGLASSGVGVRVRLVRALSGELLGGFPLTDGPATKAGSSRVMFLVKGDF